MTARRCIQSPALRLVLLALVGSFLIAGSRTSAQDDFDLPPLDDTNETEPETGGLEFPDGSTTYGQLATVERETRECHERAADIDDCLTLVAAQWMKPEPCDGSGDRSTCLDRAAAIVLPECIREMPRNIEKCHLIVATELGSTAGCDRIRPENRALCYGTAAATRRDPSLIDPHVSDARDKVLLQAAYARETLDIDFIDQIDFSQERYPNMVYDGIMTGMILPLAIEGDKRLPENFCDRLRGNYRGDYPDDADYYREGCDETLRLSHEYFRQRDMMENDAEREELKRAWAEELSKVAARFDAKYEEFDRNWRKEEQQRQCVRTTGTECPDAKLIDVPEGALTFYSGQANELVISVWNGTAESVREIAWAFDGAEQWIQVSGILPSNIDIAPLTAQEIKLTFTIPANAPENEVIAVGIVAGPGESPSQRFLVARFDVLLKRRQLAVSEEFFSFDEGD